MPSNDLGSRWKATLFGATLAILLVNQGTSKAATLPDSPDRQSYAEFFHVETDVARREMALADEARILQANLETAYPSDFAGLWIQHYPQFRVVVALTSVKDKEILAIAGPGLEPFIETRTHRYSLRQLSSIAEALPITVPSGFGTDIKANQLAVDVLVADGAQARDSIVGRVPDGSVRIDEVPHLPTPISHIHAGHLFHGTCDPLGDATFGWSVEQDGSTLKSGRPIRRVRGQVD